MSGHTPGPWRYDYEPGYCGEIIASNGQTICTFGDEPLPSNSRLIAAAPELLAAAKLGLSIAESWIDQEYGGERFHQAHKVLDPIRAAISKATGK